MKSKVYSTVLMYTYIYTVDVFDKLKYSNNYSTLFGFFLTSFMIVSNILYKTLHSTLCIYTSLKRTIYLIKFRILVLLFKIETQHVISKKLDRHSLL